MSEIGDRWAVGSTYEAFMGRWSRRVAPRFVSWLGVPTSQRWLDVGCGTGALTNAICKVASPELVIGCDPAEALVEYARKHTEDARVSFVVAGSGGLPRSRDGYGSVTSLFALNFLPDAGHALEEMRSLASGGGTISACVWDYQGRMEFLRTFWDVAASLDPGACELDEGRRFPLCRPEALSELFLAAGLEDVRCEPIEMSTDFASFEDYWKPFLGGTGPAPSYVASLEPRGRDALAEALERALQTLPDGRIVLTARAWAVRGRTTRREPAGEHGTDASKLVPHGVRSCPGSRQAVP
ncbi:MAG: class I SAM-dependent methyltransferase [Acidobacteriota bacterium]